MTDEKDEVLRLRDLCIKYANIGLLIDIEFSREGVMFRGFWDMSLSRYDTHRYNRCFNYLLFEEAPLSLEDLIDQFKEDFKKELEREDVEE